MLSEFDLRRIRAGLRGGLGSLELILHPADRPTSFGERLLELARAIQDGTAGAVSLRTAQRSDLPALPGLTLSCRGRDNIHYLALPVGHQAPPFVEALLDLPRGAAGTIKNSLRSLSALRQPAQLLVFIAGACPHCPQAVRAANRIALTTPQVSSTVIDAQIFEDLAQSHGVKSVPQTVIDGELNIAGVLPPAKLAEKILTGVGGDRAAEVFLSMVESGRFDQAARRVEAGFQAAWQNSTTRLRMGLMLTAEKVLGDDPRGLDFLVLALAAATRSKDAALRGDSADLLGQIGHPSAREALRALLSDPNPDVAEIAAEALAAIPDDPAPPPES